MDTNTTPLIDANTTFEQLTAKLQKLDDKDLTARQIKAIRSLNDGLSIPEAAVAADVKLPSLYRWMSNSKFQKVLQANIANTHTVIRHRLTKSAFDAIETLEQLTSSGSSDEIKLEAANTLCNLYMTINASPQARSTG